MWIARDVYTGVDPDTGDQRTQRAFVTSASQHWGGTLTPVERQAWMVAARDQRFINRLEKEWTPSGYQYFMKLSVQALTLGYPIQDLPPDDIAPCYVEQARVYWDAGFTKVAVTLEKTAGVRVDATGFQIFRAGPYSSGGRRPLEGEYRYIANMTITWRYLDGFPGAGEWFWYKVRYFWNVGVVGGFWENQILVP